MEYSNPVESDIIKFDQTRQPSKVQQPNQEHLRWTKTQKLDVKISKENRVRKNKQQQDGDR